MNKDSFKYTYEIAKSKEYPGKWVLLETREGYHSLGTYAIFTSADKKELKKKKEELEKKRLAK